MMLVMLKSRRGREEPRAPDGGGVESDEYVDLNYGVSEFKGAQAKDDSRYGPGNNAVLG